AGQQILRELPLKPWAGRRRDDLLKLMAMLDQQIEPLDQAVKAEAQRDKMALLLQTQPGVGPITALAYVLTMGDVSRFPRGKLVVRLYWRLRQERPHPEIARIESSPRVPLVGAS